MTSVKTGTQPHLVIWRKASFCQRSECAEITRQNGEILIRSTRAPDRVVRFTGAEWHAFTRGIRAGEFRDLD